VGSFLMRQGEPADHVLVLTAGEVAIVSPVRGGGELVHTIIRAGQLIGELALLNDGRRTAGARATSPTTAWAIGRDAFWGFLESNPPASSALLRQVAARLAAREALIDDLLSLDVKSRLAKVLLSLAADHGQADPEGGTRISLHLTHRDLAGMVGASRENVSRALGAFRRRGFIDYDSDSIRLRDQEALRRLT
jgi:CRP/FNR family cyclic AMP-dependent transcriptional regulator